MNKHIPSYIPFRVRNCLATKEARNNAIRMMKDNCISAINTNSIGNKYLFSDIILTTQGRGNSMVWLPRRSEVMLPNLVLVHSVKELIQELFTNNHTDLLWDTCQSNKHLLWIRPIYFPTMCGGCILDITFINNNEVVNDPKNSLRSGMFRGYYHDRANITGGSRARYNTIDEIYANEYIYGVKGQILLKFSCDVPMNVKTEIVRELLGYVSKKPNMHGMKVSSTRSVRSKFMWISGNIGLLTTKHRPVVGGYEDKYDPRRLSEVIGAPENPEIPSTLNLAVVKATAGEGPLLVMHSPHTSMSENCMRRTFIRRQLKAGLLRKLIKEMSNNYAPIFITDNTIVNANAGKIKAKDLIAWFSDPKELLGIQKTATSILKSMGQLNTYAAADSVQLKWTEFPEASNPNEKGHPIIGGILQLESNAQGFQPDRMEFHNKEINHDDS